MRQYIVNLTNHLIASHRYDALFRRLDNQKKFVEHVKVELEISDVRDMSPEKLGEIMCAFEVGDVMASRDDLLNHVWFAGSCDAILRDLVSACLAYAIKERLNDFSQTGVPQYESRATGLRTTEVLDELDARRSRKA